MCSFTEFLANKIFKAQWQIISLQMKRSLVQIQTRPLGGAHYQLWTSPRVSCLISSFSRLLVVERSLQKTPAHCSSINLYFWPTTISPRGSMKDCVSILSSREHYKAAKAKNTKLQYAGFFTIIIIIYYFSRSIIVAENTRVNKTVISKVKYLKQL